MHPNQRRFFLITFAFIMLAGLGLRSAGLFRGLHDGIVAHPDTPKQVMMLHNFLNGNYTQYYDNRFYDGYSYGLNRLDEIIIRATQAVIYPVRSRLSPGMQISRIPDRPELFYWGRTLRVLYGMAIVLLIYGAARRFGVSPWLALLGATLYAVAPVGVTVSHFVAGDIGVDLFLALAVWFLGGYTTHGHLRWLIGCGLACGLAFTAKHQGGLGLWLPLVALAGCVRPAWPDLRALLGRGLSVLAGFIAGVLIGNPSFLTAPKVTWRNIRISVEFIKDYGVPPEFLALPFHQKTMLALSENVPKIIGSLGWAFSALAVLAFAWALYRFWPVWRDGWKTRTADKSDALRHRAAVLAVASFPLLAIFLSTALKPAVHPFHFSYNLPLMAVSVALLLHAASSRRRALIPLLGMLAMTAYEATRMAIREDFIWRRGEAAFEAFRFDTVAFEGGTMPIRFGFDDPRRIKEFYVEPAVLSVFRNRPSVLLTADHAWWKENEQLPLPTVPWPVSSDWIFMNGPVFPRNDRMIKIHPRYDATRPTLVMTTPPQTLVIGLRTGRIPARYEIDASGQRIQGQLAPHSQTIVRLDNIQAAHAFAGNHGAGPVWHVPVRFRTELGPVWATFMTNERNEAIYQNYGPNSTDFPSFENPGPIAARMAHLRYLESTGIVTLTEGSLPLEREPTPLAAGHYIWRGRILNEGAPQRLTVKLNDVSGFSHSAEPGVFEVEPGVQDLVWSFHKGFAPYDARIEITASGDGMRLLSWSLKPNVAAMTNPTKIPPSAEPGIPEGFSLHPLNVSLPGIATVQGIIMPDTVRPGQPLRYSVLADLDERISHKIFHETVIFLHIKSEDGTMIAAMDFPLRKASLAPNRLNWQTFIWPDPTPAPGTYRIDGGMWNVRTRIRHPITPVEGLEANYRRHHFLWTTVTIPKE